MAFSLYLFYVHIAEMILLRTLSSENCRSIEANQSPNEILQIRCLAVDPPSPNRSKE